MVSFSFKRIERSMRIILLDIRCLSYLLNVPNLSQAFSLRLLIILSFITVIFIEIVYHKNRYESENSLSSHILLILNDQIPVRIQLRAHSFIFICIIFFTRLFISLSELLKIYCRHNNEFFCSQLVCRRMKSGNYVCAFPEIQLCSFINMSFFT